MNTLMKKYFNINNEFDETFYFIFLMFVPRYEKL
jgi:hypothetical protein